MRYLLRAQCRRPLITAMCVLVGLLFFTFWQELPAWRMRGTASLATSSVGFDGATALCPEPGQTVELRGDSLVVGGRMGSSDSEAKPYGLVMEQVLGQGTKVMLRGQGGATAPSGLAAWHDKAPMGEIVLLAYGTNDAATRGWIRGKSPVPLNTFRKSLSEHVHRAQEQGALVGLIAPPPVGAPAMMDRLAPYRKAVGEIGRQEGVPVFDPAEAFASCAEDQPLLSRDALHLNVAGHACLGRWLARQLCRR